MRRTLARMYWLGSGLVVAACGGEAGDLFGPSGGASGTNGSGGSQVGGTVGSGGAQASGGAAVSGGAGQAAAGGSAGTSTSGGASGNAAGGVGGGSAGKGGASGAAGSAGAGGSAGKGGTGGSAGKGGAGGGAGTAGKGGTGGSAGGAVATGGVSNAGAGGQAMCDAMRAELPKLLTAAQVCDISLDRLPCTGFVNNECGCKVPVDGPSLPPAQSYVTAVAAVTKCGVICPTIACAEPVAAHCQTEGTLTKGHCVVGVAP